MKKTKQHYEALARLHHVQGALLFNLEVFGDHLAEREGYKEHEGIEAIRFYLMGKYGWLPSQVRSLSAEDIRFAIEEEFSGWTLPVDLRHIYPG